MVVLPLVPVTPTSVSAALGSPARRAAASARTRRGSGVHTSGRPPRVDRHRRENCLRAARPRVGDVPRAVVPPSRQRDEEIARGHAPRVERDPSDRDVLRARLDRRQSAQQRAEAHHGAALATRSGRRVSIRRRVAGFAAPTAGSCVAT